jgi:hypothetical protein
LWRWLKIKDNEHLYCLSIIIISKNVDPDRLWKAFWKVAIYFRNQFSIEWGHKSYFHIFWKYNCAHYKPVRLGLPRTSHR